MDSKLRIGLFSLGILFVFVVLGGVVYYLSKAGPRSGENLQDTSLSSLPTISGAVTPGAGSINVPRTGGQDNNSLGKTYQGSGFTLSYPANWGILTCSNSQNFEFDPVVAADARGVLCGYAVKPITVLTTSKISCPGETLTIGTNRVTKSKAVDEGGEIDYRWCLMAGTTGLDITHRVSLSGDITSSPVDLSAQIEQIISTIQSGDTLIGY